MTMTLQMGAVTMICKCSLIYTSSLCVYTFKDICFVADVYHYYVIDWNFY